LLANIRIDHVPEKVLVLFVVVFNVVGQGNRSGPGGNIDDFVSGQVGLKGEGDAAGIASKQDIDFVIQDEFL
jgi:hypothetical protein